MVKWKKMNKKMAGLLLGVMMLFTASTTAFAYVDESAEASKVETTQTEQSTDKEEKKDEATNTNEVLPEDGTDQGTAFTTPGNGEVKDDITDDSTKEFLTVTTKNNNTFYIVIDRIIVPDLWIFVSASHAGGALLFFLQISAVSF